MKRKKETELPYTKAIIEKALGEDFLAERMSQDTYTHDFENYERTKKDFENKSPRDKEQMELMYHLRQIHNLLHTLCFNKNL